MRSALPKTQKCVVTLCHNPWEYTLDLTVYHVRRILKCKSGKREKDNFDVCGT
jgi:hypothetical protein